jgi:hypothetical protein
MSEAEPTSGSWCGWKARVHWIILSYLMGTRTRDLPACSFAPQSSILELQLIRTNSNTNWYYTLNSNNDEIRFVRNCCTCTSPWPSIHSTSLPLHNLHFHTTVYPTLTNFISLYFTSWNITALYYTSLHVLWFSSPLHFTSCITFLTISLQLLGLQERVPIWSYLQRNIFWHVFCFQLLIFLSLSTLLW